MNNKHPELELRSEEIQEILTKTPHWMLSCGNGLIMSILGLVLFFSWLIKYPDIVSAEVTITTLVPPEKIIAQANGRFEQILIKNKAIVKAGNPLAVIENTALFEDVLILKNELKKFSPEDSLHFPIVKTSNLQLGNIGNAYTSFEKEYTAYNNYISLKPHNATLVAHKIEKSEWQQRFNQLKNQQSIAENEKGLKKKEFKRFKTLYEKGVISTQELEQKEVEYLQQEKNVQNLKTQLSQLNSSYNNLQADNQNRQTTQKQDNINYKRNMILAYYQLQRSLTDWERQYVLKSVIDGEVTFLAHWAKHQQVVMGDEIFGVVSNNKEKIIGKIKVKGANTGKIKINQEVLISLTNFPEREFGRISGKILNISSIPDKEGNLLIDVSLPNNLNTNYKKQIPFQQEMIGNAHIVTQDLRLIERLLYQFRDIFNRG